MSFDILFQTCRYTGKSTTQTNPFTGKPMETPESESLTPTEINAVRKLLKKYRSGGDSLDDGVAVRMPDGAEAEVFASNLESSCMVSLRGLTPALSQFLFELLQAGNWVMMPVMAGDVSITTAPDRVKRLPRDVAPPVECQSAEELGLLLTEGVKGWQKYRDQVTRGK